MAGRRRGPVDAATLRPVNPQVRTQSGAAVNFRLCAISCREHLQHYACTDLDLLGLWTDRALNSPIRPHPGILLEFKRRYDLETAIWVS